MYAELVCLCAGRRGWWRGDDGRGMYYSLWVEPNSKNDNKQYLVVAPLLPPMCLYLRVTMQLEQLSNAGDVAEIARHSADDVDMDNGGDSDQEGGDKDLFCMTEQSAGAKRAGKPSTNKRLCAGGAAGARAVVMEEGEEPEKKRKKPKARKRVEHFQLIQVMSTEQIPMVRTARLMRAVATEFNDREAAGGLFARGKDTSIVKGGVLVATHEQCMLALKTHRTRGKARLSAVQMDRELCAIMGTDGARMHPVYSMLTGEGAYRKTAALSVGTHLIEGTLHKHLLLSPYSNLWLAERTYTRLPYTARSVACLEAAPVPVFVAACKVLASLRRCSARTGNIVVSRTDVVQGMGPDFAPSAAPPAPPAPPASLAPPAPPAPVAEPEIGTSNTDDDDNEKAIEEAMMSIVMPPQPQPPHIDDLVCDAEDDDPEADFARMQRPPSPPPPSPSPEPACASGAAAAVVTEQDLFGDDDDDADCCGCSEAPSAVRTAPAGTGTGRVTATDAIRELLRWGVLAAAHGEGDNDTLMYAEFRVEAMKLNKRMDKLLARSKLRLSVFHTGTTMASVEDMVACLQDADATLGMPERAAGTQRDNVLLMTGTGVHELVHARPRPVVRSLCGVDTLRTRFPKLLVKERDELTGAVGAVVLAGAHMVSTEKMTELMYECYLRAVALVLMGDTGAPMPSCVRRQGGALGTIAAYPGTHMESLVPNLPAEMPRVEVAVRFVRTGVAPMGANRSHGPCSGPVEIDWGVRTYDSLTAFKMQNSGLMAPMGVGRRAFVVPQGSMVEAVASSIDHEGESRAPPTGAAVYNSFLDATVVVSSRTSFEDSATGKRRFMSWMPPHTLMDSDFYRRMDVLPASLLPLLSATPHVVVYARTPRGVVMRTEDVVRAAHLATVCLHIIRVPLDNDSD
jgi:hypothetical protein